MDRSIARPSKLTGSILAVSADIVIRRWSPGQSDEWLLVEVKGGAKDVDRYARAAAYDLLAYRTAFDKVLTDNRKAYGFGIAWGAGLEPAPELVRLLLAREPSDLLINAPLLSSPATRTIALGLGFGDRFGGFQGRSGSFKEMVLQSEETKRIAGKARYQAASRHYIAADRSLHGKEGVDGSSPSEGSATIFGSCRPPRGNYRRALRSADDAGAMSSGESRSASSSSRRSSPLCPSPNHSCRFRRSRG